MVLGHFLAPLFPFKYIPLDAMGVLASNAIEQQDFLSVCLDKFRKLKDFINLWVIFSTSEFC